MTAKIATPDPKEVQIVVNQGHVGKRTAVELRRGEGAGENLTYRVKGATG